MTNTELIAKIKAEIERNRQAIRVLNEHTEPEQMSKTCAIFQYSDSILSELLSFLSTLESEKPIPNDLEEAAKAYALDTAEDSEQYSARYLGYKDGAKWQKQHDDKELSEKIAGAYQLGLADKEKQMLEEAVEGTAHPDDCEIWVNLVGHGYDIKDGDKVRVIVLPKEDDR